jgi:hypothetical protein
LLKLKSLQTNATTPLTGISLPQLTFIDNKIELFSDNITTLDLPLLHSAFDITLGLPALRSWSGTDSLQTPTGISIEKHNISSLSFGNLSYVSRIFVNFNFPGGSLYFNGTASIPEVLVTGYNDTSFATDLEKVGNMTVLGCEVIMINSISAWYLGIASNPHLESLELRNIVSVGGSFEVLGYTIPNSPPPSISLLIAGNAKLGFLSFPSLKTIQGSMQITDNDNISIIDGFTALRNVTNDILINGDFSA